MDCEICANGNKLSQSLQKERERQRVPILSSALLSLGLHIISQSFGARIKEQGQLNQALQRDGQL